MKKQNLIMIAVILVIVLAGMLAVGSIQGWFDKADDTAAILSEVKGIVYLQRGGVSFAAESGTVLRAGDQLTCEAGATAAIYTGSECRVRLDDTQVYTVTDPSTEGFALRCAEIPKQTEPTAITTAPTQTEPEQTVPVLTDPPATDPTETSTASTEPTMPPETAGTEATEPQPTETTAPEQTSTPLDVTLPLETTAPAEETVPPETQPAYTCTIAIRCDTILANMDNLDPAKAPYVPDDGWILWAEMSFSEGETVFEVLQRACSTYGIQLEYSWTPMYNSYYIEGINNLYEFDCGYESGWMYKVNGWFPNYGCSSYPLSDGDSIVWCYTCNGLGADVGSSGL